MRREGFLAVAAALEALGDVVEELQNQDHHDDAVRALIDAERSCYDAARSVRAAVPEGDV